MILGGTGHRLHLMPGYRGDGSSQRIRKALLETAMEAIEDWGPSEIISGMATGWDMSLAFAAWVMNVPFRAYVPFIGQERLWSATDQTTYRSLMDEAAEVRVFSPVQSKQSYIIRDQAMVDDSTRMAALYFGDPTTGTGQTLQYADGWLVPWTNYADAFCTRPWTG